MQKFKLVTLLGIRPDYIRMAKLIKLIDNQANRGIEHILVHSGQHYDHELFSNFLEEFGIRKPDFDLSVGVTLKKMGKENHAYQTSLLGERVYDLIQQIHPDAIMYLGDTNTVLSAVIVARCGIPVIHLEAGGRSFDWRMPEEKNRIVADHLSDALYCYLPRYKDILLSEGIEGFRVTVIGNIIIDAINDHYNEIEKSDILQKLNISDKKFILVTLHREENISNKIILENKLKDILRFSRETALPIVFPLMPRTGNQIRAFDLENIIQNKEFKITKPLGFFDFTKLERTAKIIVSDSGTVQEDALILGTPCVIARRSTERPETIFAGATILEGFEGDSTLYNKMIQAIDMLTNWDRNILNPNGGSPSERICADLIKKIESNYFNTSRQIDRFKNNIFAQQAYGIKDEESVSLPYKFRPKANL